MPELPPIVQAMLEPKAYPEPTSGVALVQTQMSFVFLTDSFVYKVKKPVNLGYLDYSTLDKRHFYCHREVELNRRLCPQVYLGVIAISRRRGKISIGGNGEAMEYAVKMRRLPQERMMDVLLTRDQVSLNMLAGLAGKLARFHRGAETNEKINAFGSRDTISQNTEENFSQTQKYIGKTITGKQFQQIRDYTNSFIRERAPLFQKRIKDGRIRDCHGDLHAAHICFTDDICIYDCIEFNDRFRYGDVSAEVAFLAMDLDHYGRADLGRHFVNSYTAQSQDEDLTGLLVFYKCYRAYVRGKVESFKLDDPYISQEERGKAQARAGSYFDLAYSYVKSRPSLFITVGLVGSGKSSLALALASRLGLVVISSDITRKRLASIPITEHRFEGFDLGIYSPEFSRKTYQAMSNEARHILNEGGSVIMDASFIKAGERLKAKKLAEETRAGFYILECTLDEESTKKRLAERLRQGSASDGRWAIFRPQQKQFEPVVEASTRNHVIIDTSKPIDKGIRQILERVN